MPAHRPGRGGRGRVTSGILGRSRVQWALHPPSMTRLLPVTDVAAGGAEVGHRLGDLLRLDQALDRGGREHDLRDDLVLAQPVRLGLVGDLALDQRGAHVGGVDAVGGDPVLGALQGDDLGQPSSPCLAVT